MQLDEVFAEFEEKGSDEVCVHMRGRKIEGAVC